MRVAPVCPAASRRRSGSVRPLQAAQLISDHGLAAAQDLVDRHHHWPAPRRRECEPKLLLRRPGPRPGRRPPTIVSNAAGSSLSSGDRQRALASGRRHQRDRPARRQRPAPARRLCPSIAPVHRPRRTIGETGAPRRDPWYAATQSRCGTAPRGSATIRRRETAGPRQVPSTPRPSGEARCRGRPAARSCGRPRSYEGRARTVPSSAPVRCPAESPRTGGRGPTSVHGRSLASRAWCARATAGSRAVASAAGSTSRAVAPRAGHPSPVPWTAEGGVAPAAMADCGRSAPQARPGGATAGPARCSGTARRQRRTGAARRPGLARAGHRARTLAGRTPGQGRRQAPWRRARRSLRRRHGRRRCGRRRAKGQRLTAVAGGAGHAGDRG